MDLRMHACSTTKDLIRRVLSLEFIPLYKLLNN